VGVIFEVSPPSQEMSRFSWGFPNLQVDHLFKNKKMCGPPEVERIDTQNDARFEAGDTQKNPNHQFWERISYLLALPPLPATITLLDDMFCRDSQKNLHLQLLLGGG